MILMKIKYKKVFSLITVFVLLIAALCTLTACNSEEASGGRTEVPIPATKPALNVESVQAKAGDKGVEVLVKVVNNPGILGMSFDVYYDDTVMVLTEATSELNLDGYAFTAPAYYRNPTTFLWDAVDMSWTEDGTFLKLHFDILGTAPAGEYKIKIMYSYGNIFDANLEPIDVGVRNGYISVA